MTITHILDKEKMIKEEMQISYDKTDTKLKLKFDLGIVELLGSQLYTKLPAIISEFVSNSYDADATEVKVIVDENKLGQEKITNIIIEDNGTGLAITAENCIEKINNNFLSIGRKRRKEEKTSESLIFKRRLQGKKGIGKLAGFGITNEMIITTVSENICNAFKLDYNKMKETTGDTYYPEIIINNESTEMNDGTKVELLNIRRKKDIDLIELSESIVKRLQIFDQNFKLQLIHIFNNLEVAKIDLTNNDYLNYIKEEKKLQFSWKIPADLGKLNLDKEVIDYFNKHNINGEIFTTETPLKKEDQGIILYANKKLCQENYSFNERANDNFYSYLIGQLNIDYIDEDIYTDNISTSRDSLVWENEISQDLQNNIDIVIKRIQNEWRDKRKQEKEETVNKKLDININDWINSLALHEQESARKLVNIVINDETMNIQKTTEFIGYIQDMYSFSSFKDFAAKLIKESVSNLEELLKFIKDWEFIEAKEMAKIAEGRINAINNFELMVLENQSETKYIQPFLEKFPWILDPKINEFRREVTFAKILKEKFPDDSLEEQNRRIDFLCLTTNNDIYILELKRPNIKIDEKYHNQIYRYQEFAMEKYPNKNIITTLVSDNWGYDRGVELMFKDALAGGKFLIKSYSEMILEARNYHKDLIFKYEELCKIKEESK